MLFQDFLITALMCEEMSYVNPLFSSSECFKLLHLLEYFPQEMDTNQLWEELKRVYKSKGYPL